MRFRSWVALRGSALLAGVSLAFVTAPPPASAIVRGDLGTVDTLAGPTFCEGQGLLDSSALTVRALAVDPAGAVHVDTGRPEQGILGRVDAQGQASVVSVGTPTPMVRDPLAAATGPRRTVPAPARLASDRQGGVLVAGERTLVHLRSDGSPTTVAGRDDRAPGGNDGRGGGGDGGPAGEAVFGRIASVASDRDGNAYVAEELEGGGEAVAVRFVNRSTRPVTFYPGTAQAVSVAPGSIGTIAGGDGRGDASDGEPALSARLHGRPPAIAVADTRLYVAYYASGDRAARPVATVRLINLGGEALSAHGVTIGPGAIHTVAGGRGAGYGGDGGPARAAVFSYIPGIAADQDGNLFLADEGNHRIRKVDPAGTVSTFAGSGGVGREAGGFNGNDLPARQALLNRPYDVDLGPDGRVYVSDRLNGQVRFVDAGGTIRPGRGNGVAATWTCDSDEPVQGQVAPVAVATHDGARIYLAASSLSHVLQIAQEGVSAPLTLSGERGEQDGAPRFTEPVALATRPGGGIYVLDNSTPQPALQFLNTTSQTLRLHGVTVPARSMRRVGRGLTFSPAIPALTPLTTRLAADAAGNLFIADFAKQDVHHLDPGGKVSNVVPRPSGKATEMCCARPGGLALDSRGNLYVADTLPTGRVWFLNRGSAPVTVHGRTVGAGAMEVVAGAETRRGIVGDRGPALEAELQMPGAVTVDRRGNLFIADLAEHVVRRVDGSGVIETVAGTGTLGFNGDGLKGPLTALRTPVALALDRCGNLLIAEVGSARLRRLNLVTCPAAAVRSADGGGGGLARMVAAVAGVALVSAGAWAARSRRSRRDQQRGV